MFGVSHELRGGRVEFWCDRERRRWRRSHGRQANPFGCVDGF